MPNGMKEKVVWLQDQREVRYDAGRFSILRDLRREAERVGSVLGPGWSVHGSIARGDVKRTSDIDLIFPADARSYMVEFQLQRAGIELLRREVVMATPNSSPKGHIQLGNEVTVTFPLVGLRPQEEAFYRFGGVLPAAGLERAPRVPGVSKKLLLIIPIEGGHIESSIIGKESEIARLLKVPVEVVLERTRVLARRDRIGRTGVYMREEVPEGSTFEETLKFFSDRDPVVRHTTGGKRKR